MKFWPKNKNELTTYLSEKIPERLSKRAVSKSKNNNIYLGSILVEKFNLI